MPPRRRGSVGRCAAPGVVIVKHTNPCGAAERPTLLEAWTAALEADPISAFGGVVALTREVDRAMAEALTSIFLEIVVAPAFTGEALEVLATKPNLRVLVDERLASDDPVPPSAAAPTGSIRTAGGAVLVTTPDIVSDDPTTWTCATRRAPTDDEQLDLDLAWRLVRGVTSNAIVLVRDRRLVGMGSGQTSRVDAARQAVAKAHAMLGDVVDDGRSVRLGRLLPVPRRGRGVPRRRRACLRPAGRLDARRGGRSPSSTRPTARCSSRGPATSATDRGPRMLDPPPTRPASSGHGSTRELDGDARAAPLRTVLTARIDASGRPPCPPPPSAPRARAPEPRNTPCLTATT